MARGQASSCSTQQVEQEVPGLAPGCPVNNNIVNLTSDLTYFIPETNFLLSNAKFSLWDDLSKIIYPPEADHLSWYNLSVKMNYGAKFIY